jgi:enoyl-CoA hydratase/carnithine racemase
MPQDILIERTPPALTIRINRPAVRNACRAQTLIELNDALRSAAADESVRCVILAGAGDKAFCAGADLKEMALRPSSAPVREIMSGWWDLIDNLRALRKPVIAAVRGYAVGGGTEIVLACHITIAADTARFGLSEIRSGHIPGAAGTVLLPRQIGYGPAAYYLLTGDEIPARDAERFGLVSRIVPDGEVEDVAQALAARLAKLSPAALSGLIVTLVEGRGLPIPQAIDLERKVCADIRGTADFAEGLRSFVEKREPRYGGEQKESVG